MPVGESKAGRRPREGGDQTATARVTRKDDTLDASSLRWIDTGQAERRVGLAFKAVFDGLAQLLFARQPDGLACPHMVQRPLGDAVEGEGQFFVDGFGQHGDGGDDEDLILQIR